MFARNPGNGGDQGHLAVIGVNLVETQQHPGVQTLLDSADMALDLFTARNDRSIGGDQIFSQFEVEVFTLLQLSGVKFVIEPRQESCSFGNDV